MQFLDHDCLVLIFKEQSAIDVLRCFTFVAKSLLIKSLRDNIWEDIFHDMIANGEYDQTNKRKDQRKPTPKKCESPVIEYLSVENIRASNKMFFDACWELARGYFLSMTKQKKNTTDICFIPVSIPAPNGRDSLLGFTTKKYIKAFKQLEFLKVQCASDDDDVNAIENNLQNMDPTMDSETAIAYMWLERISNRTYRCSCGGQYNAYDKYTLWKVFSNIKIDTKRCRECITNSLRNLNFGVKCHCCAVGVLDKTPLKPMHTYCMMWKTEEGDEQVYFCSKKCMWSYRMTLECKPCFRYDEKQRDV